MTKALTKRFEEFHAANPHVYALFSKYTKEAIDSGKHRMSHWLVINRIRWDSEVLTQNTDGYKISNDFIALYARKFMAENPMYKGFFGVKEMKRE